MEILRGLVVVAHLVGMAAIVGSYLLYVPPPVFRAVGALALLNVLVAVLW